MSMYNGIELELERLKAEKPEIEAEKARILNAIEIGRASCRERV